MPCSKTITPFPAFGLVCQPETDAPESLFTTKAVAFNSRGGSPMTRGLGATSAPATNQDAIKPVITKHDAAIIARRIIRLRRISDLNVSIPLPSKTTIAIAIAKATRIQNQLDSPETVVSFPLPLPAAVDSPTTLPSGVIISEFLATSR